MDYEALSEMVFIFHEQGYERVLKDPLYVSSINKSLFLNSNPALES